MPRKKTPTTPYDAIHRCGFVGVVQLARCCFQFFYSPTIITFYPVGAGWLFAVVVEKDKTVSLCWQ